jgi:predicted oxidoreductase
MKTIRLGSSDLQVTRLCYGAMRLAGCGSRDKGRLEAPAIERGIKMLEEAVEAGYTFIDHANVYGGTKCEAIHGLALERHPEWRSQLVVATKCGIRWPGDGGPKSTHRYDFSGAHIRACVDESLQRLRLERIDLYQLHRPDWLADPAEIAEALVEIHRAGKVRWFGVSNFRPTLVEAVQAALPFPLVSNQVQIHFLHLDTFEDGTLDQCLERKMSPLAWGPIAGGRVAAALDENVPLPEEPRAALTVARLRPVLKDIAQAYGVPPLAIVMAWLMRHPSGIIPIVGTTRREAMREAALADRIELDRESWYRILIAARGREME